MSATTKLAAKLAIAIVNEQKAKIAYERSQHTSTKHKYGDVQQRLFDYNEAYDERQYLEEQLIKSARTDFGT